MRIYEKYYFKGKKIGQAYLKKNQRKLPETLIDKKYIMILTSAH